MLKNKPVTLLIAAGLVLLLIAAAGVYPLVFGNMRGRMAFTGNVDRAQFQRNGQLPQGGFQSSGGNPPQGNFQGNTPSESDSNGTRQFPQNGITGNFNGTMPSGTMMNFKLLQLLQVVLKAGAVIVILLGVLAIIGILVGKDWGRKAALATAIVSLLFTAAGFFGFVFGLTLWIKIAALAIVIAILVLSSLPKSRIQATVPA